ncbi:RNA polymerase Rpb6 family protein [Lyngbya aestuarii BL J]|uniref:DNA-directed RNA polymerase subunit omega n=1 Tax=Lyngbya aestuarii BL J TaxID=1348334 RepID=U7QLY1_9CYAN|nr:DNA-directed RNA polymerase subunit omega [Lyngbya aestuarii]ERT08302.1 RNA polymerase Rpb6 family protein [Lyngbya aestuarii BL J]
MYNTISSVNSHEINRLSEQLIKSGSSSRYQIIVQVAKRAKRFRYEDFDNPNASEVKPVVRAIVEMSDEVNQPELIIDEIS